MRSSSSALALLLVLGAGAARAGPVDSRPDTAFPSYDYELDLAAGDAAACRDACARDAACCAYTFGPACRLKSGISAPVAAPGKASGLRASCVGLRPPAAFSAPADTVTLAISALPAKHLPFWAGRKTASGKPLADAPLEERILPMPAEAREFTRAINASQGFSEVPVTARVTPDYEADFRAALAGLPESVKRKVAARFSAVLLASDLGSTALTDSIVDGDRQVSAFTALDVLKTNVPANEWAANKESSPFKPDKDWSLTATLETPAGNTRAAAIQYILLHEFGHVLAMGADIHPRWDLRPSTATRAADYPFFSLSWKVGPGGKYEKTGADAAAGLPPLHFYQQSSSTLDGPAMEDAYRRLEKTDFATLYGATNPFDDFAEAFVSYVHVVLMKKPYRIVLARKGKPVLTYGACWDEPRCAAKRKMIEEFLAR
jgi:hypothetical protein